MIIAAIPTTPERAELCKEAVEVWKDQFDEVWVIYDSPNKEMGSADFSPDCLFAHDDVEAEGITCIPKRTGYCRSYLNYKAWQKKEVEWVVHLDDDVRPIGGQEYWRDLVGHKTLSSSRWFNTMVGDVYPRGHPYSERKWHLGQPLSLVHGLWKGMPDLDAITCLSRWPIIPEPNLPEEQVVIPPGQYFAMSGMAVAIHRELLPAAYFTWGGWDLPLNKYGDIWCGVVLKKICDHLGKIVTNGGIFVQHDRASNIWANLRDEAKAVEYNEKFWKWVDQVELEGLTTVVDCYERICTMWLPETPQFDEFRGKMQKWIELFL